MDLFSIFITGLFAGGLTCLAVQGGLLTTSIAQQKSEELAEDAVHGSPVWSVAAFLVSRLISYTILGALLGLAGSFLQISIATRSVLQILVSIFMLGVAANLLQLHPIFRYFIIQPPKFLMRFVRKQSKNTSLFGPAVLGFSTVFIPCGATQAMMAYALASGSFVSGGVIMFVFILGTSPLFLILGVLLQRFQHSFGALFNKMAAVLLLLISGYSLYSAVLILGNTGTVQSFLFKDSKAANQVVAGAQSSNPAISEATIYFTPSGYKTQPSVVTVAKGSTVTLNLVNENAGGCIQAFTIPSLNVQKIIRKGAREQITITAPEKSGTLSFMCSMGMYRGSITVL